MQTKMFWNFCNKHCKFCYTHIFSFCLYFNLGKDQIKYTINVLGVLFSNQRWFLARWCLVLLLVCGKSLNPNGNHLLAQRSKIPRSTSFVHILILVELLVTCVQNFFSACMSLNPYCCTSLRNLGSGLLYIGS